jgi:two-component system, chemotaxis family, CheB/CheR fusion protein
VGLLRFYVIPRDKNLRIVKGVLQLQPRQRTRTPHRPIDGFFESLAEDQRERAIGVVLSGTASDGTQGLEAIKANGGITFAQDESAKQDSMPRSAVAAGCVDLVLSPSEIAKELARIAQHPYVTGQPLLIPPSPPRSTTVLRGRSQRTINLRCYRAGRESPRPAAKRQRAETARDRKRTIGAKADANGYKKIILLLRNHCGVDFSLYKSSTVQRRITRRLVLNKQNTLADYADFLRGKASLQSGFNYHLVKPVSFKNVQQILQLISERQLSVEI